MAILSYYLENIGETFIFECNYDVDFIIIIIIIIKSPRHVVGIEKK